MFAKASSGGKRGRWRVTDPVGQVENQVVDLDLADLELAVEPAASVLAAREGVAGCGGRCAPLGESLLLDLDPLLLERRHGRPCALGARFGRGRRIGQRTGWWWRRTG